MRMDVHAFANPEGLGTGGDVVMALGAVMATLFVAFAVRKMEKLDKTVGDGVTNDDMLGG